MRTLHVAALPFPSPQGTQALLHAMLDALSCAGHDTHLACYGYGSGREHAARYQVHRARPALGRGSLRSGPSLRKGIDDLSLIRGLRALHESLGPDLVLAHHVEAALAAWLAGVRDVVFVAHTSLSAELPTYFASPFARPSTFAGRALDVFLCRRAKQVLAVSPLLAERLREESGVDVRPLSLPWRGAAPPEPSERVEARRALTIEPHAEVVLYAGNLDGYQGLAPLVEGLRTFFAVRPRARLLLASHESPRRVSQSPLGSLGKRTVRLPTVCERARRVAYAAADVVVVPRASPGGIPVKLLDALTRGAEVIACERATAGVALSDLCRVVANDDGAAFARALHAVFTTPEAERLAARPERAQRASRRFEPARFVDEVTRLTQPAPS